MKEVVIAAIVCCLLSGCVTYEVVEKKSATPTPRIIGTPGEKTDNNQVISRKWWETE